MNKINISLNSVFFSEHVIFCANGTYMYNNYKFKTRAAVKSTVAGTVYHNIKMYSLWYTVGTIYIQEKKINFLIFKL